MTCHSFLQVIGNISLTVKDRRIDRSFSLALDRFVSPRAHRALLRIGRHELR